jgi:hypothetical protein
LLNDELTIVSRGLDHRKRGIDLTNVGYQLDFLGGCTTAQGKQGSPGAQK